MRAAFLLLLAMLAFPTLVQAEETSVQGVDLFPE
jgi:hypothetical protein